MLGKIIKYEFKDTSKICGLILLVIAVMTLIGALGLILPVKFMSDERNFSNDLSSGLWIMMLTMTMILYVIMLMGVTYGMMIYQGVHFYKTMYSDEGYLTQTLPVTKHQLLIGKTLVAGIWYLLVMICVGISVVLLVLSLAVALNEGLPSSSEIMEFRQGMREGLTMMNFRVTRVVISAILAALITPFSTMLMIFGALTIGQLSGKYKALMGILAYFGVMIVNMILSNIMQFIFSFGSIFTARVVEGSTGVAGAYDSAIIVGLIMGGGMYFISHYILTKRLNME
ncbi:MAG: hypothetical protein K2O32_03390 [Acetatifactor sp.]|nr:hypothetical protein [Acetatifactor sp.]